MSHISDAMKAFHENTMWIVNNGMMADLAIEDTNNKVINWFVMHKQEWKHGEIVDFISMDEGTGIYTVYALCTDDTVLAIPEEELDNPEKFEINGHHTSMVRTRPQEITGEDADQLADRVLDERERIMKARVSGIRK